MRLRPAARFVLLLLACAVLAVPATARNAPLNVLVGTEVSPAARATMSTSLWARLVAQWVGEHVIPFTGKPTLEDCARAKSLYVVSAPFELKPRLPGSALHVNDRVAAQTHVTVVNCITKQSVFDQLIPLESNPVSTSNEGDLEPVAEVTWESSIRGALRSHPIVFSSLARVTQISPPFAFIEGGARGLAIGQTMRIYAGSDGTLRSPPVILTIVDIVGRQIQAQYDSTNPANKVQVGDLVEPYAAVAPSK